MLTVAPVLLLCLGVFIGCGRAAYFLSNRYREEFIVGEMAMAALFLFFERLTANAGI